MPANMISSRSSGIQGLSHHARLRPAIPRISRPSSAVTWVMLIGMLCLPPTMAIYPAGIKLTPGRVSVILLLLPALITLQKGLSARRTVVTACDIFVFSLTAWMIVATIWGGSVGLSSTAAEALEFLGSFLIGRAYYSESAQLQQLIRAFKIIFIILFALALIEFLSGRYILNDFVANIFHVPFDARWWVGKYDDLIRHGFARATATFEHPILYGSYCGIMAAIFLYSENSWTRRITYFGICLAAGFLSISSGPLLCFFLIFGVVIYDHLMKSFPWRWKAFTIALAGMLGLMYVLSNDPLAFFINHLVLDPDFARYRILTWQAAIEQISLAPMIGIGFNSTEDIAFIDHTIDCLYLVLAI